MKYPVLISLFIILFIAGTLSSAYRKGTDGKKILSATVFAKEFFPEARSLVNVDRPFPHILAKGDGHDAQKILGYVILSKDLRLSAQGYGGPVPIALALTPKGEIKNILALPNNETPSYISTLDTFLKQFLNKTPHSNLLIGKDIDAISHATITSEALTLTTKAVLQRFSTELLGNEHTETPNTIQWRWQDILIPLILLALAVTALLLGNTPLRWLAMAGGFIFFGVLTRTMLSIIQTVNTGLLNIPDLYKNTLWFSIMAVAFIPALIIGRIYCGALCPFAIIQEILPAFFRRTNKKTPVLSQATDAAARTIKYVLLLGILTLSFILGNASAANNIEPYLTMFTGHGSKIAWAFLLFVLVMGIFHFRFWCLYFCPVGALTGLVARFSFFTIQPKGSCNRCRSCIAICPTKAIQINASGERIVVDPAECILCAKCLQNCKDNRLSLCRKP